MNSLLRRSQGDWPFRAGRSPFYYGWVIAAVSTLGFIMSIPGQTMGMAVFADAFMEAFGLSRTELSTAYLLGTTGSALFLTRAGRLFDRRGVRARPAVARGLAYGVPEDEIDSWSKDRRTNYAKSGASIADNASIAGRGTRRD